MTNFVAIYRGKTIATAKMIAASPDPAIVAGVASQLLDQSHSTSEQGDPTLTALADGRRKALAIIAEESTTRS